MTGVLFHIHFPLQPMTASGYGLAYVILAHVLFGGESLSLLGAVNLVSKLMKYDPPPYHFCPTVWFAGHALIQVRMHMACQHMETQSCRLFSLFPLLMSVWVCMFDSVRKLFQPEGHTDVWVGMDGNAGACVGTEWRYGRGCGQQHEGGDCFNRLSDFVL